jgi:hypothetical protein
MRLKTLFLLPLSMSLLSGAGAIAETAPHTNYNPSEIVAMKPGQTVHTVTEAQLGNVPGLTGAAGTTAQITLKPGQQSPVTAPNG